MKYYIDGKEVTELEAQKQAEQNQQHMESGDFSELMKCKFITVSG